MRQLFLDMDGVLADFVGHHKTVFGYCPDRRTDEISDWTHVNEHPSFFRDIPPMPDMTELWDYAKQHNPIILTGVPREVAIATKNKLDWGARHLRPVPEIRGVRAREKYLHAKPGDVIVDDWEKYKDLWIKAGGVWITHTSAVSSIQQLRALGL